LDDDVRGARQVHDHFTGFRVREVERQARLAGVDPDEVRALIGAARLDLRVAPPRVVAFARTLDLVHARAHIAQKARAVWPGQHRREIEKGEAGEERFVSSGHGSLSWTWFWASPSRIRSISLAGVRSAPRGRTHVCGWSMPKHWNGSRGTSSWPGR